MSTGYPEELYKQLSGELQQIKNKDLPEEKAIEESFASYMRYEQKLLCWQKEFQFANEADEIYFFKSLKPAFIAYAHYYKLRYQAVLFRPKELNRQTAFYEYEMDKTEAFLGSNAFFYDYLKSGATDQDRVYFLHISEEKSGMDILAGTIGGVEMYRKYVLEELKTLKRKINS
jgi:hypothetical protein